MGATIRIRGSLISYKKEWLLCAAGPFANFLCAAITYLILRKSENESEEGWWFFAVSVMLGALNLILAEGFDGGRMLYTSVASIFGVDVAERTIQATSFISIVLLWMISVFLLIRYKTSLTLFVFTLSLFYRLFLSSHN
jgi:amino acid transporter